MGGLGVVWIPWASFHDLISKFSSIVCTHCICDQMNNTYSLHLTTVQLLNMVIAARIQPLSALKLCEYQYAWDADIDSLVPTPQTDGLEAMFLSAFSLANGSSSTTYVTVGYPGLLSNTPSDIPSKGLPRQDSFSVESHCRARTGVRTQKRRQRPPTVVIPPGALTQM